MADVDRPTPPAPAPAADSTPEAAPASGRGGALGQLLLSRMRLFWREPEAVFWVFGFPILMAIGLGIAFKARGPEVSYLAVERAPGADEIARTLNAAPLLHAEVLDADAARDHLRTGKVSLAIVPPLAGEPLAYRFDLTRPDSRLARALADDVLQRAAGRTDPRPAVAVEVTERGSRYIDFLIPGLIGMNLMSASMWGIGWSIVETRSRKLLKRLAATPMRRSDYLLAHILARLVFLVVEVGAVLLFGWLTFSVGVKGSFAALAAINLIGAFTFSGMGLLVASRARTTESVSGLMNLVMMPMFVLSGVFFTSSHFPDLMQPFIRALPLTALNDGLRAVMIDGASLLALPHELIVLVGWGLVSFVVALRLFRWS